jgi:hypothetical protein
MTPQEKAKDLFDQYIYYVEAISERQQTENAKQCALICVEELLKDKEIIDGMRVINDPYWLEVKQEIEKIY